MNKKIISPMINMGRISPTVSADKITKLMPNILSSKKSLKKERERRLVRIAAKKALKKIIKEGNLSEIHKAIDSQAAKGIIKKNKRNRLKSRYTLMLNKGAEA